MTFSENPTAWVGFSSFNKHAANRVERFDGGFLLGKSLYNPMKMPEDCTIKIPQDTVTIL